MAKKQTIQIFRIVLLIEVLIDKTLGYPHKQYIKKKILIPLRLKHTFGSFNEANIDNVMTGYYVGIDKGFLLKCNNL